MAVRFVHGAPRETGVIQGHAAPPNLQRVIDVDRAGRGAARGGLLISDRLADKLGLRVGDSVTVELREGRRLVREVTVQQRCAT